MTRKRQRRYKLLDPSRHRPTAPARVENAATILQWAVAGFMLGVLVAFLLIVTLFTKIHPGRAVWLNLWPASLKLMTASGLTPHQTTHLAFLLSGENGLLYAMFGTLLGGAVVGLRMLFRRMRRTA